jgi:hypothetical protein
MCRILVLCVLAALAMARPGHAQDEPPHTRLVLGLGINIAGGDSLTRAGPGPAGQLGLIHQRDKLAFAIRLTSNSSGSEALSVPVGTGDHFDEFALMAGYSVYRSEKSQMVLTSGVAYISGERSNVEFETTIGVPIQLLISAPGGRSGFGLSLNANLNREEVFGGFTVTYLLGLDPAR